MSGQLPTGTVTFLFTDIEGSTRILSRVGSDRYTDLLTRHHEVVRAGLDARGGVEMRTEGDAFFAVFTDVAAGVDAAIDIQRSLESDQDLADEDLRVRMGLHTGEAVLGGDNYTGLDVHIAARVSGAAHGGQILVTDRIVADGLGADASYKPLGEYWLKDIDDPVSLNQVVAPGLESNAPPPRAPASHPVNAPVDLSSFLGRDDDVANGTEALKTSRLVTLTGPGGTGKTRLSVEIGTAMSKDFSDGAFFVPLAGISDPSSVPNQAIDAVGAPMSDPSKTPIDALATFLQHRSVLLIMDNFEHVLDARTTVTAVLEASPGSRVLVTSRTPLGVSGEQEIGIAPLNIADAAVELFAERARSVRGSFALDDTNRTTVEAIVRRLDGLPLAIELAAARVRMMSCEAILETLDPLSLSGRTAAEREVTLADTIRWSYDLLSEPEQKLLTRLGAFPTGAGLDQIITVTQPSTDLGIDPFSGLGSLVDHSLLVGDHSGASPRFRMLETVREFAIQRLDETSDERQIRDRHAAAYLAMLEEAQPHLDGKDSKDWMTKLGVENANLQTALSHAVAVGDADTAQRIVSAAWQFWKTRGHLVEATDAASSALALDGSLPEVRAEALDAAGSIAYWVGDAPATRSYYEEAVAIRRDHDITDGLAAALYNLSFPVTDEDGLEAATELLDEASEVAAEEGNDRLVAYAHVAVARTWLNQSPERALENSQKAIDAFKIVDDPISEAWAMAIRSAALHHLGDHRAATRDLQVGLVVFAEANDLSGIAVTMTGVADNARRLGDDVEALYFVGAVRALRESSGIGVQTALDATVQEFSDAGAVEALEPELRTAYELGHSDPLDTSISKALAYTPTP
ncbi:MAG: ATP-binding protein [Acidimicrobiia bacterium]